jgi:hypothetical protein
MMAVESGWARLAALLGALSLLACGQSSQHAGEPVTQDLGRSVVARVGDDVITVDDLGWMPARVSPEKRLEMLVMRRIAAREARRRGLTEEPKTRAKLAEFRFQALTWEEGLLRNALYNSIRLGMRFSEPDLRAQYEANKQLYAQPQWTLRVRMYASEAEARAADAQLGATGRLDPAQSETLGPAPVGALPHDLVPVLPRLVKPGDRQVVGRPGGWSLVELDAHLRAEPLPFERVRDQVDQDLRAFRAGEILDSELARLRAEEVVIDQAVLAAVEKRQAENAAAGRASREARAPLTAAPAEAAP